MLIYAWPLHVHVCVGGWMAGAWDLVITHTPWPQDFIWTWPHDLGIVWGKRNKKKIKWNKKIMIWYWWVSERLWYLSSLALSHRWKDYGKVTETINKNIHCQTSNISCTKSQNLNVSRLVSQLCLPNPLKSGVKWKMKMTGNAPTTFEGSAIILHTKVLLILEVWRYQWHS